MNIIVLSSIFSYSPRIIVIKDRRKVVLKMADHILTLKEVAEYLKLAEKTAYRLASERKLPGFKVGGSWRFKREDLEAWIEEQKK